MSVPDRSVYDVEDQFKQWLIVEKKQSKKVAGDIVSRCKRIERELGFGLLESFSSNDAYIDLMRAIRDKFRRPSEQPSAAYSRTSTLRHSVRKLLEFSDPEKLRHFKKFRY